MSEHPRTFDLLTVGHAIVDVLAPSDDEFLDHQRLVKGSMELIESERALALHGDMVRHTTARKASLTQASGGSAANTAVVAAMMGARSAFIGKVYDDELGHLYTEDMRAAGVHFDTLKGGVDGNTVDGLHAPTGRCLINVTPDAERTMCTYLGAARGIRVPDVRRQEPVVAHASVTYFEGYLWDVELARAALELTMDLAHAAGKRVALSLSDPFCVDRFRDEWQELIAKNVDIVFGNEHELCSLYETADLNHAVHELRGRCEIAAITRGAKGSIVVHGTRTSVVDAFPVSHVVDTTGAGDAYSGGFLYGYTHGLALDRCAELGGLAAAEVISHMGPRPTHALHDLVADGARVR